MARRDTRPDPKEAALAGARCLNPHPEQVTDPGFLASDFFDARDAVQVKYEMVRKVRAGGAPVTGAAAAFGYSRPAYYAAAAPRLRMPPSHAAQLTLPDGTSIRRLAAKIMIGRSSRADIVFRDWSVRPFHAIIRWEAGSYILLDLGASSDTLA